jgi:tRNA A-37 threonylcarbamoyl transferase component Bud32
MMGPRLSAMGNDVVQDVPGPLGVELLDRLGSGRSTFRARSSDGTLVVVRRLDIPDAEARDRVAATLRRVQGAAPLGVVPVLRVQSEGDVLWMTRAFDAGLPVRRLTTLASPTASQVGALGIGMLEAVRALHAAGVAHGSLHGGNVLVRSDGSVRLADAGIAVGASDPAPTQARRSDIAAVAKVLGEVWRPARRQSAPKLAALLEDGRLERTRSAATALELVKGATGDASTAVGLGALVARLLAAKGESPAPGGEPADTVDQRQNAADLALQEALAADRRQRILRAGLVVLVVAVAVGLAIIGVMTLARHSAGSGGTRAAPPSTVAAASTPARTAPPPAPVPAVAPHQPQAPAPPAAGIISAAILTSEASCQPGVPCTLTSRLNLLAHAGQDAAWEVMAVDECTGTRTVLYGASIFALAQYEFVYDTRTARIPGGHSVALYTVSTVPAEASSSPVTVGSGTCG